MDNISIQVFTYGTGIALTVFVAYKIASKLGVKNQIAQGAFAVVGVLIFQIITGHFPSSKATHESINHVNKSVQNTQSTITYEAKTTQHQNIESNKLLKDSSSQSVEEKKREHEDQLTCLENASSTFKIAMTDLRLKKGLQQYVKISHKELSDAQNKFNIAKENFIDALRKNKDLSEDIAHIQEMIRTDFSVGFQNG
jgi:hypothetical protein